MKLPNTPWLDADRTQSLTDVLEKAGHQALFVGGCVRNTLLGAPISDIDLATDAHPDRVQSLFEAAGHKVVPTGVDHGTLTVIIDHAPFEVTTFRSDVSTDGRRATVAFTTEILHDAERRDFTMNALYADRRGTLFDPVGGINDLNRRRIRFIGNAEDRIREDYLRILRFFRFHAWYGDPDEGLDAEGLAACAALADGLETLSKERIGQEIRKLLAAPDPGPSVASMQASGVLMRVLPGAVSTCLGPLIHFENTLGLEPHWERRLASLGVEDWRDALRLSRNEIKGLKDIRQAVEAGWGPAETAYRTNAETAYDVALLRAASTQAPPPAGLSDQIKRGSEASFPLSSADLIERYGAGPALGAALKALEDRWIASDFVLDHAALLKIDTARSV